MFGQRDNKDDNADQGAPAVPPAGTLNTSNGIPDDHAVSQMLGDNGAPALTTSPANSFSYGAPSQQPAPAPAPEPTPSFNMPDPQRSAPPSPAPNLLDTSTEDLVRMKQEALQHLQPLVGTLQQNPEEEFRTIMMMIRATDDKTMLKKALEAAKKIGDDKIRAQAMLDVVNEINYFTQTAGE